MAVMCPGKLPQDIIHDPLRSAERKVYNKLKRELDDSFKVFYSRPWLGLTRYGEEKDGECDFLIAHPFFGILTIEVKGGGISYNPEEGKWFSRDRYGREQIIKDPSKQATSSKYQILTKLKQQSKELKHRWIPAFHGVIFPDSERPDRELAMNLPLNICCFSNDFESDLKTWILSRFGNPNLSSNSGNTLGNDGIDALNDLLCRPIHLHFTLGKIIKTDDAEIQTLTQKQYHILDMIAENPHVLIQGGAGTGKTVLATEEAIRCANAGKQVLFICYNRPLALTLRYRLNKWKTISVYSFHEFCIQCAKNSGIYIPDNVPSDQLFRKEYPCALVEALKELPDLRFDAIIIDEGQDFFPNWYSAIYEAFKERNTSLLRIFYDSNQSVYENITIIPTFFGFTRLNLNQNLRNTKKIHKLIQKYYNGYPIESLGPEGVDVVWIPAVSSEEIFHKIDDNIHRLIKEEQVIPSDITVLFSSSQHIRQFLPNGCLGNLDCRQADEIKNNAIVVDTIRRFKGLESRIVILAAFPELTDNNELIYVALSRARTLLIIIGDIKGLNNAAKNNYKGK